MSSAPIFRPSFGNRPDRIVGREDVLQAYSDGLASYPGSRDRSVLITGQRGMDKTALLLEMADAAAERSHEYADRLFRAGGKDGGHRRHRRSHPRRSACKTNALNRRFGLLYNGRIYGRSFARRRWLNNGIS